MFAVLTENQSTVPSAHSTQPMTASNSGSWRFKATYWPLQDQHVNAHMCTHTHTHIVGSHIFVPGCSPLK